MLALASFSLALQAIPFDPKWNYPDNLEWQKTDNSLPRAPLYVDSTISVGSTEGYYWAIVGNDSGGYDLYVLNDSGASKQWVKKNSIVSEQSFTFDKICWGYDYAVILGKIGTNPVILTPTLPAGADWKNFDWMTTSFWETH